MHFAFARKSRNAKTGDIPVTTSDAKTCPDACPLKSSGACYAKHGPLGMYWKKINAGQYASTWQHLLDEVKALPEGQLWRHNQAGDLPGDGDEIDCNALIDLVSANSGKRGFTYTHKPVEGFNTIPMNNRDAIRHANANGFTVNLSADNLSEADSLKALNIGPVVTVLPREAPQVSYTPQGHKVVVCPAQTRDDVTCKSCGLCAISSRDVIVGFLAHGVSAKKAEAIALA
jgi:hypothetical protein